MKRPNSVRRRGQPLLALILLMVSWVGARAAMWEGRPVRPDVAAEATIAAPKAKVRPARPGLAPKVKPDRPDIGRVAPVQGLAPAADLAPAEAPVAEPTIVPPAAATPPQGSGRLSPADAAGHQWLYTEGMNMPTVDDGAAADTARQGQPRTALPSQAALIQTAGSPWSADAWLVLRQGGNGYNAPGAGLPGVVVPVGFYGGSQAGLVLRYGLAANSPLRPALYVRASSGLEYPRGEEVAAGLAIRPVPGVPVMLMGEGRVTRTTSGTIVRPAVALVSQLPPARLPFGVRGEGYVQAGYVGGQGATPFIDGQVRIEKPVVRGGGAELRLGGGAWGGAQKGANRLDLGPTVTLAIPVGPGGARVSADYRVRVAGQAAPGSGAVLTLSAGF